MANEQRIDQIMREIESFGYGSEEYHEALGFLLMVMARSQWRRAELVRRARIRDQVRRERRERARAEQ